MTNSSGESRSLRGADYTRHNHPDATHDELASRWVAVDESGWDGEQLYGRGDRYLVLGTVAIDDDTAAPIVDELRRSSGVTQPPELKAAQFIGSRDGRRLDALADLLAPQGVLADRTCVYMVDKHYFVAAKIIDLLLEEHFSERGLNFYEGGFARQLARILFSEGPRALGPDGFARLIKTMVDFASMRNRGASQVSVDMLFKEIDSAWARSTRRQVTTMLLRLRETRSIADDFLRSLDDIDDFQAMEPLIPSLSSVATCGRNGSTVSVCWSTSSGSSPIQRWTTYARSQVWRSVRWVASSTHPLTEPSGGSSAARRQPTRPSSSPTSSPAPDKRSGDGTPGSPRRPVSGCGRRWSH